MENTEIGNLENTGIEISEQDMISTLAGYDVKPNEVTENVNSENLETSTSSEAKSQQELIDESNKTNKIPDNYIDINDLPEEIKELALLSKRKDVDINEYKAQKQREDEIRQLPARDFLKLFYASNYGKSDNRPDGLTEDQIEEELDNLSPVKMRVEYDNLKNKFEDVIEQRRAEIFENKETKNIENNNSNQYNDDYNDVEYNTMIEQTIANNQIHNDIFGIPLSEADKKEIPVVFKEWTKINPKTGTSAIYDALQDDDLLYKVIALIHKGEANIKGKVSDMKEAIKKSIIDKLGITPEGTGGGTASTPNVVNPNLFI